jgi:hypothetical protein
MWEYANTHEYIGVSEYVGGERICGRCVRFLLLYEEKWNMV